MPRVRNPGAEAPDVGEITIHYRDDRDDVVNAALVPDHTPLKADIRTVLDTAKGGVINLPKAWAGRRVVVVEMPEPKGRKR